MLRILFALACFVLFGCGVVRADSAQIVAACGTQSMGTAIPGSSGLYMDKFGNLCVGALSWNGTGWDPMSGLLVGTAGAPATDVVTVQSPITAGSAGFPAASVPITASSGNVAAATATATLAANSTKTTYLCGFSITSAGSTAATVVSPTVTGLVTGTMPFTYVSVAGVTLPNAPLVVPFTPCAPASAINTAVVVSLPSLGSGNTNTTVSAWGYQQ